MICAFVFKIASHLELQLVSRKWDNANFRLIYRSTKIWGIPIAF